jgi:hypothetical protein
MIDKAMKLQDEIEYRNSWLFTPLIWDVLFHKYLPNKCMNRYTGEKDSFLGAVMCNNSIHTTLNDKINSSRNFDDRVLWEIANQQIFFTKDKSMVSEAIKRFYEENKSSEKLMAEDHIRDRFYEVSNDIDTLTGDSYCFVFKNSSVDDGVVSWFRKYNAETEEYDDVSLLDAADPVAEFVLIEGNTITFVKNTDIKEYVK